MHIQGLVRGIADSCCTFLEQRQDESARTSVITRARALIAAFKRPNGTVKWLAWGEPTHRAAVSTAIYVNSFPLLSSPRTADEVAHFSGASLLLVERLLRHLATTSVIMESGQQPYPSTTLSDSLCVPRYRAALTLRAGLTGPVLGRLPTYLASTSYQDPRGQDKTPFQYAFETNLSPWD